MSGKKFRFSLDSVLKLRSHEAECARQDLAHVREEIRRQEALVEDAERGLRSALDARLTGSAGQHAFARQEAHRQIASDRLQKERRKLDHLKEMEEEARLTLMQRKGAEETIRNLEEQERTSYLKKLESAESEQLDEQAITGFQRRRAANS